MRSALPLASLAILVLVDTGSAVDRQTSVISNGRLRLEFQKISEGSQAYVILRSIASEAGGPGIDLSESPVFCVGLQSLRPAVAPSPPVNIPREQTRLMAPSNRVILRRVSATSIELEYKQVELEGTDQKLNVTVNVSVRDAGGPSQWTGAAELVGDGDQSIVYFRLPCLRTGSIGKDGADDTVAYPMTGGLLLHDPIRRGRTQHVRQDSTMFNYPGYVESQFIAYYDNLVTSDPDRAGLYLAAEDPDGHIKRPYFKPTSDAKSLDIYLQHYNFAPAPLTRRDDPWKSLSMVSIGKKLPYVTTLDLFEGDWVDAADRYRNWLDRARPVFLSKGKLANRDDIPSAIGNSAYAIGYVLAGGTAPIPRASADLAAIQRTLEFYSDRQGNPLPAAIAFVGDITAREEDVSIGNDMGVFEVRRGLPEFLWELREARWSTPLVSIGLNRDIGNWVSSRAQNKDLVLKHGLVTLAGGNPLTLANRRPAPFAPQKGAVKGIVCGGSPLMQRMRLSQFDQSWQRFMRDGKSVVTNTALSGRGTEAALCYGPLYQTDAGNHHPIGGGAYWMASYRTLVNELRRRGSPRGMHILPVAERAHEQMIDTSELSGRARVAPWDLSFHGPSNWVENGVPVPIRSYLFHDYALIGARLPRLANVARAYVAGYQAAGEPTGWQQLVRDEAFMTLQRQRLAQWTVEGHRLGMYIQGPGPNVAQSRRLDSPPGDLSEPIERYHRFMREMLRLRREASAFLIEGRMLRPPRFDAESSHATMPVAVRREMRRATVPGICASAWRSQDGSTAIVLANYTNRDATAKLHFNATSWGLAQADSITFKPHTDTGTTLEQVSARRTGTDYVTDSIRLTADRPTRVLVVAP